MRTLTERRQVNKWLARGASDYAIAGITGIPRSTVQRWRTELLGIRWTQSNPRNISISHRKSVAVMDEFIGPKC